MSLWLWALIGGGFLGLSAGALLLLTGRIAGISGLIGSLLMGRATEINIGFLAGLLAGPWIYVLLFGEMPAIRINASTASIIIAGLLVGFGTRMGSGCTSGHGILGLARLSPRSIAATASFLVAGILAATLSGALQ